MASQVDTDSSADRNVEIWKIKKLIKSLELARGYEYKILSSFDVAAHYVKWFIQLILFAGSICLFVQGSQSLKDSMNLIFE